MPWFKRLFCKHKFAWIRNIYGDEILLADARSVWRCMHCGKCQWRHERYSPQEASDG